MSDEIEKVTLNVAEEGVEESTLDRKAELRLTRKMDMYLIPVLGILYLLSFLDRGNIGNANVATPSLSNSLHLDSTQYAAAVSIVYATYIVFEPVWANLVKVITPKVTLAVSALAWGAITIGTAFCKGYGDIMAIRLLLGIFEAGLYPSLMTYILMNYRREEVGQRVAYIMTCAALSGAFGGLIAYGLIQIENTALAGWQYLYLVEGILSLLAAPLAYFWIPNTMDQAWFLSSEEKQQAKVREEMNKLHYNPEEQFTWKQVVLALSDWKTYWSGTIQFAACNTLYGFSTFMPIIIKGMGYSNVNAQLLTVPVYILGAASFLIVAKLSDRYKIRSPFIVLGFFLQIIGYIILATCDNVHGRYGGVFIVALGLYLPSGLNVTWLSGNMAGHYKRVTGFATNQLIGNAAGASIGTVYASTLAPRYFKSLYISIGLSALGLLLTVGMALIFAKTNKNREQQVAEGADSRPEQGDRNVHFKFYL